MPTLLARLLLLALLVLPLAACAQAQPTAAPTAVEQAAAPAQTTVVPALMTAPTSEEVAVAVVEALVAQDTAALQPLVSADMAMRDIEIEDKLRLWRNAQVRNGICGGPVTSIEAVETTQRGERLGVRVLTRCAEKDGPSSLGRGGIDITLVPAEGGYQVLDWEMVDGIELRDRYADY